MIRTRSSPLLTVMAIVMVIAVSDTHARGKSSPEKLQKAFKTIQDYLEEVILIKSVEFQMQALENWLVKQKSETMLITDSLTSEALRLLVQLRDMSKDTSFCGKDEARELLELIDKCLATDYRSNPLTPNYRLTKLDSIINYYAEEYMRNCGQIKIHPALNFIHMQNAYDTINDLLEQELPGNDEVEANFAQAEKLLLDMGDREGILAAALQQLLGLKAAIEDEKCDHKIILQNDLATRGQAHTYKAQPKRRIDKLVNHYSLLNAKRCRDILPKLYKPRLTKLSKSSYYGVLALTSFSYLDSSRYDEINTSIKQKTIDLDYTIPPMVEYAKEQLKIGQEYLDLGSCKSMPTQTILEYIKSSNHGMDLKFLLSVVDEKCGKQVVRRDELQDVIEFYVSGPCSSFSRAFGPWIEAELYNSEVIPNYLESPNEEYLSELSNHIIRAGYQFCKYTKIKKESIVDGIIRSVRSDD